MDIPNWLKVIIAGLGVTVAMSICVNCVTPNSRPKPSTSKIDIETVNDTANFIFAMGTPHHWSFKAEKKVKVICNYPKSVTFVNKIPNTENKIIVTLKYR